MGKYFLRWAMSLVSVSGAPWQVWSSTLELLPAVHSLDGLDRLQQPLHELPCENQPKCPMCVLHVPVETPVSGGHSDWHAGPRWTITSKHSGEGLGLPASPAKGWKTKRRVVGPPWVNPASLSLTSSLLTSMFHTAIPPSEEQETSCLVSWR